MSKELLHLGVTTESTYTDIGADTPEGFSISSRSRSLAREMVGNATPEDRIRQRCSIAVGDWAMADLLRFENDPVSAGLAAIAAGAPVFTDIRMVLTGIQKRGHSCPVACALDYGADISREMGITRSSAGFVALKDQLEGSVVVIGNAPSALLTVCGFVDEGICPALIVGTPVGFVNAAESKEGLRTKAVPSVSNVGTRGGTPVAVASLNEIITMYSEQSHD
ncbi:MAG: precorrin-8X methylmutase [Methanocalculaceae archaeon]|jgi:precorrin-8X/cobalt-precorrin-8 methylmutase|nr:precorrin-8X methylmutase [Methanocalculaceae archaeon]